MEVPCGYCKGLREATSRGHKACLEFVYGQDASWDAWASVLAVMNGHLWCLEFARKHNCVLPLSLLSFTAAERGKLDCLQFIYEHYDLLSTQAASGAAEGGYLNCLKYIYENCGQVATWEQSGLQDFEQNSRIPEAIKEYLRSVQDDWRNGLNIDTTVNVAKQ